jgi:PAS domain S-box-containing protein
MTEKILVVDDEFNIRQLVSFYLERWGYEVDGVESAEEARERLAEEAYALLLTDIRMPGESGLELTRHAKSAYPDIIVIFLSVLEDQDTAEAAMAAGAYAYLTKPLRHNEMRLFVQNGLQRRRLELANRQHVEELEARIRERTQEYEDTIHKLKANREALQSSEERLRSIMEAVQAGILIIEKETQVIVDANPAALRMFGASGSEVVGKECQSFICPVQKGQCPVIDLDRQVYNYEETMLTVGGSEIQILKTVEPLRIEDKEYLLESFVDISELKQTEQKLTDAYSDLESLFSSISSIFIQMTPRGVITRWNLHAESFFGLPENSVLNKTLFELALPWDREALAKKIDRCRKSQSAIKGNELAYQQEGGKKRIIGFTISPRFDSTGVFTGILLMGSDITERKNLEFQLAQAQKLESIGQLAAGIAHEINTPIQYIGDNTRFFKDAFDDLSLVLNHACRLARAVEAGENPAAVLEELESCRQDVDLGFLKEEIPAAIEQTLEGVDRVSAIVRSMKDFSHPGAEEKVQVDINKALTSTGTISRNEWKYVAELACDLEEGLPMVACLPGEMNQVFLNIIVNAAHAIADKAGDQPDGKGTITITTRSSADEVEIRIADTGKGIPEANRSYIFDPFYTTKEVGKGTGQGLALAHSTVVEKHGGSLTFETEEGKGTAFIIRLPLKRSTP